MHCFRSGIVLFSPVVFLVACESSVSPRVAEHPSDTVSAIGGARVSLFHPGVDTISLAIGRSAQLSSRMFDRSSAISNPVADGAQWSSTRPATATVDSTGIVTASAVGRTTIIVRMNAMQDSVVVNAVLVPVAKILLTTGEHTPVRVSANFAIGAVAIDAAGDTLADRAFSWSSSDSGVATISQTGMVSGISPGSAIITVSSEGQSSSAFMVVLPSLPGQATTPLTVTLSPSTVKVGSTTQASVAPYDTARGKLPGRAAVWTSLKPGVARVSSAGVVTAVSPGSAIIRATVESRIGEATIVVGTVSVPDTVAHVAVIFDHTSVPVGQPAQAVAIATDANGTVLTGHSVTWASLTPSIATVSPTGVVTTLAGGTATIRAIVDTKIGDGLLAVTQVATTIPGGTIPTADDVTAPRLLETSVASTPSAGRTLRVAAGDNLQRALDTALAGDRILLAAGATFTGNFVLGPKRGTSGIPGGWITVQSDGALPPEGARMTARAAASFNLPKLATPTVSPVLATSAGAARWRLIGIELTADNALTSNYGLILLGDGTGAQNAQSDVPRNLILDRTYIHGQSSLDLRRCVALNSDSTAVIDSYISECHSNGFDTQAVWGWNGNGPYKIVNNYLEASTEVAGFGGADPAIAGLVPSDVEIRGNHITRPMSWKGGPWLIKNLIELKNARRVLIEGNVLENSWPQAQIGWAFVLFSVNQNGGCSWCVVQDVTIRNNLIRNVAAGFSLSDMYHGAGSVDATPMNRISISNNVMIGVDNAAVSGGGYGFQINRVIATLHIEHNTFFIPSISAFQWNVPTLAPDQVIRNNLSGGARYSLFAAPTMSWASVAGAGSDFAGNVVATADGSNFAPTKNWFPASMDGVGLAGGGAAAFSVTSSPSALALSGSSPYKGKATDGTDPGADIAAIMAATANAIVP